MNSVSKQTGLIIAIVFAAISISGPLIFLGVQLGQVSVTKTIIDEAELTQKIEVGIEKYARKQRVALERAHAKNAKLVRRVSDTRDHIYGNPDAKISLIEYSDFECPFCKRFHPTAKKVVEAYGNKVNWVYRHFPLAFHNPGAQTQAEASECANELGGNKAFWRYADLIYERTTSNGDGFPLDKLVPLAKEIGLDERTFRTCLDSGKYTARVKQDLIEGAQIGISGTPGNILLNNETGAVSLKMGAVPLAALKAEIERLLN